MASENADSLFERAISLSLDELGLKSLKKEQRQAVELIVLKGRDVLAVLPTGFGKSLIFQVLPGVFDSMTGNSTKDRAIVLVVAPLNALMRDQISKLNEKGVTSFMVQGQSVHVGDSRGGECASFSMEALKQPTCRILFVHPEVCVNDKSFFDLLKSRSYQRRVKCVAVDEAHLIKEWKHFRPAYGKLDILSSIFPDIPHIALTATATKSTQKVILESLKLVNAIIIEVNPDRSNIFYESKPRPSSGENKLDVILSPLAQELKEKKMEMPLTIVYGTLSTCADSFLFFSRYLGKEQYFPAGADNTSENRLFAQFHAEYPQHEKDRILDEIQQGVCKARVLFVTVAFGIGVDIPNITRVIHIGVPKTMEEYFQETGRAGRDGKDAIATLFYNSRDVGKRKNPVDDVMRKFAMEKGCKRKIILDYFGHEVPKRANPVHSCCDFHKLNCNCASCLENIISEDMEEVSFGDTSTEIEPPTNSLSTSVNVTPDQQDSIWSELEAYRVSLEFGKLCVGGVTLSTGFSLELINLTVLNCHKLISAEVVQELLPVFSRENAELIYNIVSRQAPQVAALKSLQEH